MTAHEMELELLNIGYDAEYLETLQDSTLIRLYEQEFL